MIIRTTSMRKMMYKNNKNIVRNTEKNKYTPIGIILNLIETSTDSLTNS
jgi:hypothetical protein